MEHSAHVFNNSDEEEDDLDEMVAVLIARSELPGFDLRNGGVEEAITWNPRLANKDRKLSASKQRFERFYFAEDAVYSNNDFERRFRMPRVLFAKI